MSSRDPTRSLGMLVPLAPFPSTPAAAAAHLSALALPSVGGAALLPVLAAKFEAAAATFPSGSLDVLTPLLALLLGKRIVLYAVAGATVWLTAVRSEGTADGIGSRLEAVTADAVLPATLPRETAAEVQQVARALDGTTETSQVAALPVVLGALLFAASYAATGGPGPAADVAEGLNEDAVLLWFRGATSSLQPISQASACAFCCNAELQASARAVFGEPSSTADAGGSASPAAGQLAAAALALALVTLAYALPPEAAWPAQNAANACVAVSIGRVLQFSSFAATCLALLGTAAYDALGTLVATAGAAGPDVIAAVGTAGGGTVDTVASASGGSLMESVAQSKVAFASGSAGGAPPWQPGLLVVLVNGRVTDGLGLGDVVFPACLAGWAHRLDLSKASARRTASFSTGTDTADSSDGSGESGSRGRYLTTAIAGYAAGCVLLEVVPAGLSRAALLLLVPSMLTAVIVQLAVSGDLSADRAPPRR